MNRCVLPVVMSALIGLGNLPIALAASSEPQLNFKIYSPDSTSSTKEDSAAAQSETTPAAASESTTPPLSSETPTPAAQAEAPAATEAQAPAQAASEAPPQAATEAPMPSAAESTPSPTATEASQAQTAAPESKTNSLQAETPTEAPATSTTAATPSNDTQAKSDNQTNTDTAAGTTGSEGQTATSESGSSDSSDKTDKTASKALQGYIRVVPSGTKIPIIMDTAVDSDTSQEGDEFTARTAEDLNIDGAVAVPAGSIIKGRIAQMNAPKHMDRSGSVALKFDTVTTPDNRQIPLVANIVARGGVVHARRGMKDIAIDSATVLLPTLVGLAIGAVAGNNNNNSSSTSSTSSNSITKPEAAMIGVGVGVVVGVAILLAKKGKKVDVRPGDELKIQLSEELRMPMM